RAKFLDKAYSFMARVRVPGGVCTPSQWLHMDWIADNYANGTLKLTTRQAFQFHGIIKTNLKTAIAEVNQVCLDTLAACGDVNRNVMCNPNPYQSEHHAEALQLAVDISNHLTPRTSAYHEIWLDDELVAGVKGEDELLSGAKKTKCDSPINAQKPASSEEEPIYGKTYLPRKFKAVVAVPPSNDVDIYAHCLGFIAIIENNKIIGYNVSVGGGMGMTHGDDTTFPRTADIMGFCTKEQAVDVAEKVVIAQRDLGNRDVRKHARLKYTVETLGIDRFRDEVEKRLGYKLEKAKPFKFENTGDRYGFVQGFDKKWHCTLFIQNGRLFGKQKQGLAEIAKIHKGDFRLTCNQNVIIASIDERDKPTIEKLLKEYNLADFNQSGLRRNSMACVALPTCGLALAESERYLPDLVTEIEKEFEKNGIREEDVVIRMTGCPNGCARPYLAEIGLVGTNPGRYNLYLGAGFDGSRLNKLYKKDVEGVKVPEILSPIIQDFAKNRNKGEHFGDFTIRKGYVKATTAGNNFHK
ncbi:MAG: NADPH-dependent assimilatory sulfite reductase hemoprotein subunit, partial [Rickettsiales bacterium]|nr:NADPH-dependent assimilatory sulfite reductase hemoprotein subunit [Rickettsiales bacterium]